MKDIILKDFYKCVTDEVESYKRYVLLSDKLKHDKKDDMSAVVRKLAMNKKEYIDNMIRVINDYIRVEYKDNVEIQELLSGLNEAMFKNIIY